MAARQGDEFLSSSLARQLSSSSRVHRHPDQTSAGRLEATSLSSGCAARSVSDPSPAKVAGAVGDRQLGIRRASTMTSDPPAGKSTVPSDAGAQIAFIYDEAVRGLTQQQALVENLNGRAGTLVFATSFATSLLGAQSLSNGVDAFDWVALAVFSAIAVLVVYLVWPYQHYRFRFDPNDLLRRFVDAEQPTSLSTMRRELAVQAELDRANNWRTIQRLLVGLQAALLLLLVEIAAWLVAIATK